MLHSQLQEHKDEVHTCTCIYNVYISTVVHVQRHSVCGVGCGLTIMWVEGWGTTCTNIMLSFRGGTTGSRAQFN